MSHPFSLYVHYPWCWSKCPYCDFNAYAMSTHPPDFERYTTQLIWDLTRSNLQTPWLTRLTSIYLGGGTPSLVPIDQLERLFRAIHKVYRYDRTCEITMEISPKTDKHYLRSVIDLGVNRFSVGLQSFHPAVLKTLGREHHAGESHQILHELLAAGATNINVDLIYGLECQTPTMVLDDLKQALTYPIEHLSWYELMLEPNTQFAHRNDLKANLDKLEEMEEQGALYLAEKNMRHYEISAYCRERQSLHNTHYWLYGDYLGIGAGAHSKITLTPKKTLRCYKTRDPKDYLKYPKVLHDAVLDEALDYLLNRCRLFTPISFMEIHQALPSHAANMIEAWIKSKKDSPFYASTQEGFFLTPRGRLLINDLLYDFQEWRKNNS